MPLRLAVLQKVKWEEDNGLVKLLDAIGKEIN